MYQSGLLHIKNFIISSKNKICFTDLEGKIIFQSENWKENLFEKDELSINQYFNDLENEISHCFEEILSGTFEKVIFFKKVYQNETFSDYKLKISPYFSAEGIDGFFILLEMQDCDIPNKHTGPLLTTKKFHDTFYYSVIGMAIISIEGQWTEVNDKVCEMLGYSKQELLKLTFQELTHPDDLTKDLDLFHQLMKKEIQFYQIEKRYYHKAGHIIWVNLSVSMVKKNDQPPFFISQIENITSSKKAQEKIVEMENIYTEIFNASYQFTTVLTPKGKIREINNTALGFFGIKHKDAIQTDFWELDAWKASPGLPYKVREDIEKAASGEFLNHEVILFDQYSNEIIIDFTLKPVFNDQQIITSLIAEGKVVQEIIDLRMRLLESERKLRAFFNLSPVGFVVNDLETGNFVELNDSILDNTGYTREEFLQSNYWDLFPDEYRWMEPLVLGKLRENGVFGPVQLEYARKDGVRFPILINGLLTKDQNGTDQIWSVVQDISDLKEKEIELQKLNEEIEYQNLLLSNSNNELEQFAYIASHDLQEPLRMISGFLSLLSAAYKDQLDEKAREYIHFAVDGAARMRQTIVDILEYSQLSKDNEEKQLVNLNETAQLARQFFSGMINEKKAVIHCENLPHVPGQKAQLQQLFNNLISNSLKYASPHTQPKIEISVQEQNDAYTFCFSDNGIGIEAEYHEKIFTLFVRLHSKKDFEGSGIGLTLCRKIVEKHGGKIWVESTQNQGSKFYFTLPK